MMLIRHLRHFSLLSFALFLLIASTITLLVWHHFGMERVLLLNASSGHQFSAESDASEGGSSTAILKNQSDSKTLFCRLRKQHAWPYCEIKINLGEIGHGYDLSHFETIRLELAYAGPAPRMLRLHMRNFEPGFSKIDNHDSLKVNEIEFELPTSGNISFPLKLMRIASWWTAENSIPLEHSDMRIDNVAQIELSTSSVAAMGDYQIQIRSIQLSGKWISWPQLLSVVVAAWLSFGIYGLVAELAKFRARLINSRKRILQLQSINQALHLETRELAGQVRTDAMTGTLNREGLREILMKQWRSGRPIDPVLCVIFADIDHFKNINDQFGHHVGDEVLQHFASVIRGNIRESDRLVRWGGEEFLIVCPQTDLPQAQSMAEKLRLTLQLANWPEKIQLSCSFGIAFYLQGESFGVMLERADKALYLAKANGRDRVEISVENVVTTLKDSTP